jgi:hypothetical protein
MTLQRLKDGSVRITQIDEWHLEMLRNIPSLASTGENEKARQRLFPRPFAESEVTEENFRDWEEFVRPGIEQLFSDSLQRVSQDIEGAARDVSEAAKTTEEADPALPEDSAGPPPAPPRRKRRKASGTEPGVSPPEPALWSFRIPAAHVEDWYRAMNQVRLMLSTKHEAHRTDNAHIAGMFISGKMETLIQYELFTGLCSWWVEVLLKP